MEYIFRQAACMLMLLPLVAAAASPARSEYQAAISATPDYEHGAVLFAQCASCHGVDGQGLLDGSTPRIAGQHARVLIKQLVDFRYGKRWDFRMEQRANRHLGAYQDIADVASYLSKQPRKRSVFAVESETLAQGQGLYEERCASCHGPEGGGDGAKNIPMLAGQHPAYLLRQMYDAVDGRRPEISRLHSPRIKSLDFEQLRALADFLARIDPAT